MCIRDSRVAVREDSMEKLLATSDGADGHTAIYRSYIYLFMSAESADGTPVELFSPIGGFGTFDDNFTSPDALYGEVDLLYERLMQKREGCLLYTSHRICGRGSTHT